MNHVDVVDHFRARGPAERLAEGEHLRVGRLVYPFVFVYEDTPEDLEVDGWAAEGCEGYVPVVSQHV